MFCLQVRVDEWHRLRDDPDRESVVARYVAHSPLYVGAGGGGGSNLPPTPGLPPTPAVAVDGAMNLGEIGQTSKDGSDGVEFNSDVLASVNPPLATTRLAVTVDDDDGFAFNNVQQRSTTFNAIHSVVPVHEGKMSYKSMRAAGGLKNTAGLTDDGIDAAAVPSMLDELRNLKARFHEQRTDAAAGAPKTTTTNANANANDDDSRFKGGWDDDVSADLSPLPDPTDMIRDLSPEVSFRDDDDVSDEEENADDRSRIIASYGQTVMTPSTKTANHTSFEGTPTSKPRVGSSIPFATPRSPGGDGGTATSAPKSPMPKSPVGPLELAPSPPPSGSKQKNTPAPRSPSRTRNDTAGQIRNDTAQIKPQVREALVALDPIAGANVPGQPAWSVAMSAQVRAAHARKKEAKSKVEDLLGGGFDYDALRSMAKSAHDTLKGNTHGLPDGGRSSYLPKPSGGGGGQIFAAGAKVSLFSLSYGQLH